VLIVTRARDQRAYGLMRRESKKANRQAAKGVRRIPLHVIASDSEAIQKKNHPQMTQISAD
jgi:hypothetical protein